MDCELQADYLVTPAMTALEPVHMACLVHGVVTNTVMAPGGDKIRETR